MLRRGGGRGPRTAPFPPTFSIIFVRPLPSYFPTSFFCLLLPLLPGLEVCQDPGPSPHPQCCSTPLCTPKSPLPSLFGEQVERKQPEMPRWWPYDLALARAWVSSAGTAVLKGWEPVMLTAACSELLLSNHLCRVCLSPGLESGEEEAVC